MHQMAASSMLHDGTSALERCALYHFSFHTHTHTHRYLGLANTIRTLNSNPNIGALMGYSTIIIVASWTKQYGWRHRARKEKSHGPDGFHIFLRFSKALSALLSFVRGCLFGGLGDLELSGFRVSEV